MLAHTPLLRSLQRLLRDHHLARARGIPVEERAFTKDELLTADEAFYTGAAAFLVPAVSVDGQRLGDGTPGPVTRALRAAYIEAVRAGL